MGALPENDLDAMTCRRIVALLMSLAVLAERAAARCLPVRLYLFWLLRRGETAAISLFADPPGEDDASGETPPGVARCDLATLAVRLRTLALMLAHFCALVPDAPRAALAVPDAFPRTSLRGLRSPGVAVGIEDTS